MLFLEHNNKAWLSLYYDRPNDMNRIYIILLFSLWTGVCSSLKGQTQKIKNLPYTDFQKVHFGFLLGVHTQDMAFQNSGFVTETGESWYAEQHSFSPGFTVGLLADWALLNNINLRITPTFQFGNRFITFREQTSKEEVRQDIKGNIISIPMHVKYSASRVNNYRPYLMAGISPGFDLSKRKETPLVLNRFDFAIELGLGCDIYLPFFKLIPELKFSLGLVDLIKHERPDLKDPTLFKFTQGIDRGTSRSVSLLFYFE